MAEPIYLAPAETSFFSTPEADLDYRLFDGEKFKPAIRDAILGTLYGFLSPIYQDPQSWATVWLAGSGVSRQWAAQRLPGDLDCLIGVNYLQFRQSNPNYAGFSDQQIADAINEDFRKLNDETSEFMDSYELTFYVNVRSDIREIKPYAAYSLTNDDWTVTPPTSSPVHRPDFDTKAERDKAMTSTIVNRYQQALNAVTAAKNDVGRLNAERTLQDAVSQGAALWEELHGGRKEAFSPTGEGYMDYANYRWQAGKESGVVPALRAFAQLSKETQKEFNIKTYGVELPDASVLVRRAMTNKRI